VNKQQQLEANSALHDIEGQVVQPGHADYDELRIPFYGGIDPYPAVIQKPHLPAGLIRLC
jgi:hypothetical protein